ncbi:MAG: hypothetical protein ACQCN6_00370 [Candidatus Bathyarchaeia archaeon]|jgi:hypothetical protein
MNHFDFEGKLSRKIKDAEPTLDITGADRKVLQVASQDLQNYLKFISKPSPKTNPDYTEPLEQPLPKDSEETEAFLTIWLGFWLKKWKERFNLVIGTNKQINLGKTAEKAEQTESLWFRLACRYELTEIIESELIRNAEICGTKIIAENILKAELGKQTGRDVNSREQTLKLLKNCLCKARELSRRKGPLVAIKVDRNYYCRCQVNN